MADLVTAFWRDPHITMAQHRSQTDRAAASYSSASALTERLDHRQPTVRQRWRQGVAGTAR